MKEENEVNEATAENVDVEATKVTVDRLVHLEMMALVVSRDRSDQLDRPATREIKAYLVH